MKANWRRIRAWAARLLVLLLAGGMGFGIYYFRKGSSEAAVPTSPVRQGDFLVMIRCRGALRARRSVGIYTPVVPNLRVAWIAASGEFVKEGETIVRFDSSTAKLQLMQKEAQLKQSQATLDQALAQSKITAQHDQTDLADANFSLERAQVQLEQAQLRGRLEEDARRLDLGVAEQKLNVQEATVALHDVSEKSRLASLTRQRDQAQAEVDITKSRIAAMEQKAPLSGLLTLRSNCSGAVTSAECKPYKVGDNVSSNMVLGQIPDLSSLEMDVSIEEVDRGRVKAGQDVLVRVDALPELAIPVKVTEVSSLAEMRMEYPYTRSFRVYAAIPHPDARLLPDMNGGLDIIVSRIPNATSVPSKALFTREGKPIVYVAGEEGYRAVEVKVLARNPDEVAISGVPSGASVALADVERQEWKK